MCIILSRVNRELSLTHIVEHPFHFEVEIPVNMAKILA